MAARNSTSENHGWVDVRRGLVSRDVFVSDEIFRLEMERVFDRTWVFLAHETEIPAAGDFVARSWAAPQWSWCATAMAPCMRS